MAKAQKKSRISKNKEHKVNDDASETQEELDEQESNSTAASGTQVDNEEVSEDHSEEAMEYSGSELEKAVDLLDGVEISESESDVSEEEVSENINESDSETVITASGSQEAEEDNDDENLRTVFIKDLDYDLREDALREQMERLGEVIRVTIPLTHDQRRNKGFAYVEFKDVANAKKALQLNGTELLGRKIFVSQARPKENRKIFTIFAKNLSYNTNKEDLDSHFSKFGKVYNISLPVDNENPDRNKGFCFIEYTDESVIQKVMCGKHQINGRTLYLNEGDKNEDRNNKRSSDRLYGRKNSGRDFNNSNDRHRDRDFGRNKRRDFNDSNERRGGRNRDDRFSKRRGGDREGGKSDRFEKFNNRKNDFKKDNKKGNKNVFNED